MRSSRLRRHGVTLTRKREEEALRHFRCGKLELGKGGGRGAGAWPLIWGGSDFDQRPRAQPFWDHLLFHFMFVIRI